MKSVTVNCFCMSIHTPLPAKHPQRCRHKSLNAVCCQTQLIVSIRSLGTAVSVSHRATVRTHCPSPCYWYCNPAGTSLLSSPNIPAYMPSRQAAVLIGASCFVLRLDLHTRSKSSSLSLRNARFLNLALPVPFDY